MRAHGNWHAYNRQTLLTLHAPLSGVKHTRTLGRADGDLMAWRGVIGASEPCDPSSSGHNSSPSPSLPISSLRDTEVLRGHESKSKNIPLFDLKSVYKPLIMDKSRGKRPLEGNIDVSSNINLEDNDAEEDELASTLQHSREEYELEQNRGVGTRDEASKRNHIATVSGDGALTIPPIVRLTRLLRQISKELRKLPPKALLFETKLKLLGMLRRLFGTLLFIKPLSDEESLITELVLDTMKIYFPTPKELLIRKQEKNEAPAVAKVVEVIQGSVPLLFPIIESSPKPYSVPEQPPAKKQKAGEKEGKKMPGKRKRDERKEMSLLKNKRLVVQFLCELLWDEDINLFILMVMGLIYCSTDKIIERRKQIRELEAIDRERVEKLLDIEGNYKEFVPLLMA
ncbi:hypothetical protein TIFTF001_028608 [Ficus carica]|uniref:Uncharacterized protein n=1 Tax=Ficus carica TaxID=3494 RepID=A0AA88DQR1_FICCA|nr:hypothetical protein TIFTF001_028608 [Ficus carica]